MATIKKTLPQRLAVVENQVANLNRKIVDQDKMILDLLEKTNDHSNQIFGLQHPTVPGAERAINAMTTGMESPAPTRKSSMQTVQERVCFLQGHLIGQLERQIPNPELPDPQKAFHKTTITKQEILCLRCGMTLDEIRRAQ